MVNPSGILWGNELQAAKNSFANSSTFQTAVGAVSAVAAAAKISLDMPSDTADIYPLILLPQGTINGSTTTDGTGSVRYINGQLDAFLTLFAPEDGSIDHDDVGECINWMITTSSSIMLEVFNNQANRSIGGLQVGNWTAEILGTSSEDEYAEDGARYITMHFTLGYGNGD